MKAKTMSETLKAGPLYALSMKYGQCLVDVEEAEKVLDAARKAEKKAFAALKHAWHKTPLGRAWKGIGK